MEVSHPVLVRWLRAAGESSRLRLLALCSRGEPSVSDLAQALAQSEPRVSRHLKILCEAGLVERVRQGQWVHYRLSGTPAAASFVRGILAQIEPRDAVHVADRVAAAVTDGSPSRLGRALAEFATASGLAPPLGAALLLGAAHPELLERAGGAARNLAVIASTRRTAQSAAALAQQRGFPCRVLRSLDAAHAAAPYDAVILDHADRAGSAPQRLLADARALLAPAGRLWVFAHYEAFEGARERVVEHPLAKLRRLLGAAGFLCERLSPIEADGEHVLACVGRVAVTPAAAGGAA
jgi:DNA-binding transcriptional ArsR family regulator